MKFSIIVLIFVLIEQIQSSDLFSNPIAISRIVKEEKLFFQSLYDISQDNPIYFNLLNKYLNKNTLESLIGTQSQEKNEDEAYGIEGLVANPLHVFSLFYRILILLPIISKELNEIKKEPGIPQETKDFLDSPQIKDISQDDLVGVTFALIRIQQAYELDPYDMAMGRLGTRQTNARLSAEELYEIVKILYYGSDRTYYSSGIEYALAITWLEGVIRLSFEDDLQDVFIEEIKTLLLEIQDEHDKHFQEPWTGQSLLQYPNEEFFVQRFNGNRDMTSKEMRKLEKETVNKFSNQRSPWGRDFFSICRGEEQKWAKRASSSSSDQRCYVKHFSNPFLLLQPAKIEILNENPTLVQIHDVVPFSWIDKIKELSINKIVRAQVAADEGNKKSYDRTQSNAWLQNSEYPNLPKISKYFEKVTHLSISKLFNDGSMVESETYQIGVYSPGGVYLPHMDTFNTDNELVNYENEFIGNRIATLMLYLSNVDGGGTAFTELGKVAYPKMGSSVFWFNLFSDGEIDTHLTHGACPTMYGIKWVSNKWIRSYGQIFDRPCDLQKSQRMKLF